MGDVTRVDYYDDPAAPSANLSLTPAANLYVAAWGYVLIQRRSDKGLWALPGGRQDPGESLMETAVRETLEETGIRVRVTGLVGIYTDPKHVVAYYRDGELLGASQESSFVFAGELVDKSKEGRRTKTSSESTIVAWTPIELIDGLTMDKSMRRRSNYALSDSWRISPSLYP